MKDKSQSWQITSVSSMAIYLVIVGAMLVIPSTIVGAIFYNTIGRGTPKGNIAITAVATIWVCVVIKMWHNFVQEGREWSEPKLNTKEFNYFEIATTVSILFFTALLKIIPNDTPTFVHSLQTLFSILLISLNIAYFTLAWGMKHSVPAKSYIGAVSIFLAIAIGYLI